MFSRDAQRSARAVALRFPSRLNGRSDMVLASHVIFSAYGFWLPNDPRGSWSDFVGSWDLFRYGSATKVDDYRSYAHDPHDKAKRLAAKDALKYPPVVLTGEQALSVAKGFAKVARASGYH